MPPAASNPLYDSRVAFVLGAGASVPLGMPTTVTIMERLCDDTADGVAAREIYKSAIYRFRIGSAINIEFFLEHLYELQLMIWLARRSELPTLLPGFTASALVTEAADQTLRRIHRRAYQLLHELCGDCSGAKANALWSPILRAASSVQPVVPMFTLNYDWTFEKLAIENVARYRLIDGYELLGGEWDAGRFDNIKPDAKKTTLALFKLHGSTNWLGGVKSLGRFEDDHEELASDLPPHKFEMIYPAHGHEKRFGKEFWLRVQCQICCQPHTGTWRERGSVHSHLSHPTFLALS